MRMRAPHTHIRPALFYGTYIRFVSKLHEGGAIKDLYQASQQKMATMSVPLRIEHPNDSNPFSAPRRSDISAIQALGASKFPFD